MKSLPSFFWQVAITLSVGHPVIVNSAVETPAAEHSRFRLSSPAARLAPRYSSHACTLGMLHEATLPPPDPWGSSLPQAASTATNASAIPSLILRSSRAGVDVTTARPESRRLAS